MSYINTDGLKEILNPNGDNKSKEDNTTLFYEMAGQIPGEAKIPGKPKKPGLIIAVGANERNIQHFHVFRREADLQKWSNGACLCFNENRYYDHGRNNETLTEDELKAVIEKLKEYDDIYRKNIWNLLIDFWNVNNFRNPIDPNLKMPEYDCKTITRHKERRRAVKMSWHKIEKARKILLPFYNYDYTEDKDITDRTTVTMSQDQNIRIRVHVDLEHTIPPHFKIFSGFIPEEGITRVARLHFKDEGMEYHNDKYRDWILTKDDIEYIKDIMMKPNGMLPKYTNWQMACYYWNYGHNFGDGAVEYLRGDYDEKNKEDPCYIPHNQKMPETWIYNPPKRKRK